MLKNKRLKICYFADPRSIHIQRWLKYFVTQRHEIHLIPLTNYQERMLGVIYHDLNIKLKDIPKLRAIEKVIKSKRLLKGISPDIIHGHFVSGGGYFAYLSGFKPLVITAWGSDVYLYPRQTFVEKMLTRRVLQRADLITVDSSDLRNKAIELGAPKKKSYIIQFGVDTKLFHSDYDVGSLRRKFKIRSEDKVIFSPRAMKPTYNIDNIVKAFKLLQDRLNNLKLILKSYLEEDRKYREYIEELVRRLNIVKQTIFIGKVQYETMATLYNLSDVVVSISATDGTPMSVLEAMACGSCVVASNIPSLQEWIKDGWNGYLVNVKDIDEICQKIERSLLMESDKRHKFIHRNLNIIREKADYYLNMKKMENLYYNLVSRF